MHGDELERRLLNWARWYLSSEMAPGAYALSAIYRGMPTSPRGESVIPTLAGEAADTEATINRLHARHRLALHVWYLSGWSVVRMASKLGCHRSTVWRRVEAARDALARELSSRNASTGAAEKKGGVHSATLVL